MNLIKNTNKMENKYYTPTIEEFHKGFEFEWFQNDFEKETFAITTDDDLEIIDDEIREGKIRVKRLHREDAESLGWIYDTSQFIGFIRPENEYSYSIAGVYETEEDFISIGKINKKGVVQFVFHGKIKNKSELQKLMIQLEIK